jgi:hypothetical protein
MANYLERKRLELEMIEKSDAIDVTKLDGAWISSAEFYEFIKSWQKLVVYYTEHGDDKDIAVVAVREYLEIGRLLRKIMLDDSKDASIREQAEDAINDLEGQIEDIIREVVTYLNNSSGS